MCVLSEHSHIPAIYFPSHPLEAVFTANHLPGPSFCLRCQGQVFSCTNTGHNLNVISAKLNPFLQYMYILVVPLLLQSKDFILLYPMLPGLSVPSQRDSVLYVPIYLTPLPVNILYDFRKSNSVLQCNARLNNTRLQTSGCTFAQLVVYKYLTTCALLDLPGTTSYIGHLTLL